MTNQIIGGMFGLVEPTSLNKGTPPFLSDKDLLLVNARSGLSLVAELLQPSKIWMPSFLCDVMLKAVQNFDVQFYEVDRNLHILPDWLKNIQRGELVILIDYFGFPFDLSLARHIKESGAWILEDASQALLSSTAGKYSDFVLFSPRKFIGIPDGGILRNQTTLNLSSIQLRKAPTEWWLKAMRGATLRREFDLHGENRKWFQLFREADEEAPIGAYAMSDLSRILLENSFDYPFIIKNRAANYRVLNSYLNKFAIFPDLPQGIVPLGYPIHLSNRDHVRQVLFDNNIYPPVHWPIADIIPKVFTDSHHLASTIMTLVCDQRYVQADMERTAKIVLQEAQIV